MNYTINTSFRVAVSDWYVIPGLVLSANSQLGGEIRLMRQATEMPENGSFRREHLRRRGGTAWFLGNYFGVT